MKLVIEINVDNAAFEEESEAARILGKLSAALEFGVPRKLDRNLYDVNGNKIGFAKVEEE